MDERATGGSGTAARGAFIRFPRRDFEPWFSKTQAAEHFGVPMAVIEHEVRAGMPATRLHGRTRLRPSEIEPWLRERGRLT